MSALGTRIVLLLSVLLLVTSCGQKEPTAVSVPPTETTLAMIPPDTAIPPTATPVSPTATPTLATDDPTPTESPTTESSPTATPVIEPVTPGSSWMKTYRGDQNTVSGDVLLADDGGYFIVGTTDLQFEPEQQGDVYLIRTDADGEILWEKTYGGEGYDGGHSITLASDGSLLIAGATTSFGAEGFDAYLLNVDQDGNERWSKTYGGSLDELVGTVGQMVDGSLILGGNIVDPNDFVADPGAPGYGGFAGRSNLYLLKIDADGNELWSRAYDSEDNVLASSGLQTPDGGFLALATITHFPDPDDDIQLLKLDGEGNVVWSRVWKEGISNPYDLVETSDGNYLITASYIPLGDTGGAKEDYLFIKIDPEGNEIWRSTFGDPDVIDYGVVLAQTTDGGFVTVGERTRDHYTWEADIALVKIDENGQLLWQQLEPASHTMCSSLLQHPDGGFVIAGGMFQESVFNVLLIKTDSQGRVGEQASSPVPPAAIADLIAHIEDQASQDLFSGAVLIAQDDEPVFKGAFGLADRSSEIPNQVDTKFNLGSMNKMFTATAILQLAEEGKLSVDDKIIDHLPDYANQEVANQVTIHHLLTHTAGMGNVFTDRYDMMPKDQFMTPEDWLPLFVDTPLQFEPGAQFAYSNAGYVVLGLILESITGQSYYDYVRENIYEPSGMLNSDSYERDEGVPNLAIGYTTQGYEGNQLREPIPNTDRLPGRGFPAGGGYSTVEDLLKFRNALLSHQLLSPESTELLITGKIELREGLQYAYGFFDKVVGDQRAVGHSGGFPGICDFMDVYLDLGYTVIVLSNSDEGCTSVLEFLREQPLEPAPTATPVAARPPAGASLGDTWTRPADDMVMVYVPEGTFEMGSLPDTDYFGPHIVTLDGFWIDKTEATNAQFAAFLNDQGNQVEEGFTWMEVEQMEHAQVEYVGGVFRPEAGKADHPVVEVSWNGSNAYCQWAGGRLPTEAEWEFAARGPENYVYPWGNDAPTCELSQFGGCGDYSIPVGSLSDDGASWVGAKDLAGNVWEWTADYYGEYSPEAQTNPTGPKSGERKVARGGSFYSAPDTLHTAYRYTSQRTHCVPNVGFRCAVSVSGMTSATPIPQTDRSIREIVTSLQGLSLDDFFEESYQQLLLRDPERLTILGVAKSFGLRNDRLNDLSDAYIRETQELESAILDLLRTYDRDLLAAEQQVSYDVYEWYLDDRVRGHEFMYYDYPVHHFYAGYHDELIRLFTQLHPLTNKQDAEDYISRLSQVDDQVEQLLEGLRLREEAGTIPPRFIVELTKPGVQALTSGAVNNPLYATFGEKVTTLDSLTEDEKQALLGVAQQEIEESVSPAFLDLATYLGHLSRIATDDAGVWKFPNGDAYYAHILRREASVDIAPEEAHQMGLDEVARIQAEMRQVFDELGYPQDASLVELIDRAAQDGGSYNTQTQAGRDQVVEAYETILDELEQKLDEMFNIRPQAELVVIGDTTGGGGGYYMEASKDGSRPGAFHAGVGGYQVSKFDMPTIAYHEANPGHHFQIAIAQEMDLPTFRNDLFFNGYGEGWALYAERLAWELGLYEDDPYGNIGRLHLELLRAARVVADTGIHALGWTQEEAYAYMRDTVGARWAFETDRYIAWPAQSAGYKIGMIKILELRQKAMDELGDQFDIKEFHRVVLGNGSMPLDILERVVQDYIDTKLGKTSTQTGYVPAFEPDICHFFPPYGYEVECGYLIVPENRSKPDSPSIRIHVAVFKSKNPNPKPDPVIYVAGGGGVNQLGSSEYYLLNGGGSKILEDRDYIMYNQRGAYLNEPSMVCPDDSGLFWSLAKQDLSTQERADRKIEKRLECHDALLEQGIDPTAYNTVETAADVNDLRIALGYDEVNLYGTSSGTRTILTIMRNHPEGIRSVILDSVYPPQVNLYSTYALSVHRVFSLLFEECAADPDCNQKYPDLEATFYRTVDDLNANPASVQLSRGAVLVDGGFFMEALYMNFYSSNSIPKIPEWIQAASQGHFAGLKSTFESLLSDFGTFMAMGFEWSMQCHEEVSFESYELGRELAVDLPSPIAEYFDSYYEFTLCESWQSGQADPVENTAVVSDIPALVFAGQFDPITPPEWGLLAAETLSNHFFYEFPGLGHGIMRSNKCGLEIGLQFLEDPTSKPDALCIDELTGPDFK